jgi:peptidoglycan/LPS O-acetylase OafA/YrhL
MTQNRIFGLDFIRVIAVFAVIIAHAGYNEIFGVKFGMMAIESFFVMSGFLIGEMLIRDFKGGFTFSDLKKFWVKRWFRTLPLYYFILFFKFFFINPNNIGLNILYYVFFLQNNFYGIDFLQLVGH